MRNTNKLFWLSICVFILTSRIPQAQLNPNNSDQLLYYLSAGYTNVAHRHFGACLEKAGDRNGDGIGDFLVTETEGVSATFVPGSATIFSGASGYTLASQPQAVSNGGFGVSCSAGGGDIDADGIPDFTVGAQVGSIPHVYVSLSSTGAIGLFGSTVTFGWGIAHGDINGDGHADIVVGEQGQLRVYSGASLSAGASQAASQIALLNIFGSPIYFPPPEDRVLDVADVSNDSLADILVALEPPVFPNQPLAGIRVFFGSNSPSGVNSMNYRDLDFVGDGTTGNIAKAIRVIPDINGDGLQDIGVVTKNYSFPTQYFLKIFLGGISPGSSPIQPWLSFGIPANGINAAYSIASGDFDGDGINEVAISHGELGGSVTPGVAIYKINTSGPTATLWKSLSGPTLATSPGGYFDSIANIGDVNGDGFADLAVAAPNTNLFGTTGLGVVYVYMAAGGVKKNPATEYNSVNFVFNHFPGAGPSGVFTIDAGPSHAYDTVVLGISSSLLPSPIFFGAEAVVINTADPSFFVLSAQLDGSGRWMFGADLALSSVGIPQGTAVHAQALVFNPATPAVPGSFSKALTAVTF